MTSKQYEYTCEWNNGEIDYWPKIPVRVQIGNRDIDFDGGIIDSGAQHTLVNIEAARALGVDLRTCQTVAIGGPGGVGEKGYLTKASLVILDFKYTFETVVTFTKLPAELILGQQNFFDHFKILFEKDQRTFTVTQVPKLEA